MSLSRPAPSLRRSKRQNEHEILLTFFSPSGYEIRRDYAQADYVFYLPADTPVRVNQWLDQFSPRLLILTKYDFWWNYIRECLRRDIPVVLISALFRPNQYLFKWYGQKFRKMLMQFEAIFVQNEESYQLLHRARFNNIVRSGDTRIDRVLEIADRADQFRKIAQFCQDSRILLAGSSWPAEERMIAQWYREHHTGHYKIIIAPHDISRNHIMQIAHLFDDQVVLWSESPHEIRSDVLIIDSIGMLASLYQYATIAFIGGGFRKNIHNVLEPLAFSVPVVIGPNYKNFPEAVQLVNQGGIFVVNDLDGFVETEIQLRDPGKYQNCQTTIQKYLHENKGASHKIFEYLQNSFQI